MSANHRLQIVRDCYRAYESGDPSILEERLADDFTRGEMEKRNFEREAVPCVLTMVHGRGRRNQSSYPADRRAYTGPRQRRHPEFRPLRQFCRRPAR